MAFPALFILFFSTCGSLIYVAVSAKVTTTSCPCGWVNFPSINIFGGNNASINKYPFIATVIEGWEKKPVCGATIITSSHLVTAAHCLNETRKYFVLVGVTDLSKAGPTDYKKVVKKEIYQTFNKNNYKNDIAVLTVSPPLVFDNKNIGPVCVPQITSKILPITVLVLGWGKTSGTLSGGLQEVVTDVIDSQGCAKEYPDLEIEKQFCTYDVEKGPTKGDSGGPALWWDPDIKAYTLVGIISKGPSSEGSMPVILTNLPFPPYMDWIQNLSDGKVCRKDINENP